MRPSLLIAVCLASISCAAAGQTHYERMYFGHPKYAPAMAEVAARQQKSKAALDSCMKAAVDKFVTPTSDPKKLTAKACSICSAQRKAVSIAANDLFRLINAVNPDFRGDLNADLSPFDAEAECSPLPASYAVEAAKERQWANEQPEREQKMKARLTDALACFDEVASSYAMTTAESPADIEVAATAKCEPMFREAFEAGTSSRFIGARRREVVQQMLDDTRDSRRQRAARVVVEARAQRNLSPPSKPATVDRAI